LDFFGLEPVSPPKKKKKKKKTTEKLFPIACHNCGESADVLELIYKC
jgi:hypothetical protein